MVSLPFSFCSRKHIFLMVIQIYTEKHFSSKFWTTVLLNMVGPSFFNFLRDLHIDNELLANKYTKNIKWDWMGLNDATWPIFCKIDEKLVTFSKEIP